MAFMMESIGIDSIFTNEDMVHGWVSHSIGEGRAFKGYEYFYIHRRYGDAEMYVGCREDHEKDALAAEQFDLQVSGNCIWKMNPYGIEWPIDAPEGMVKRVAFHRIAEDEDDDDLGYVVVNVLNADILPSYTEDTEITIQVVAMCGEVSYYKDEEAYIEETFREINGPLSELTDCNRFGYEIGSIIAVGTFSNIGEDGVCRPDDEDLDISMITGRVKSVRYEYVNLGEDIGNVSKFLVVKVDTLYGEIELVHSIGMVMDEIDHIEEGNIVQALAVISGDVAIYEYEDGMIKDEKNNLLALKYAMDKGNIDRLRGIFSDEIVYKSINQDKTYAGIDEVMNRLDYIQKNHNHETFFYLAKLNDRDEMCLILAEDEPENYLWIVRVKMDEDKDVTKILIEKSEKYNYELM